MDGEMASKTVTRAQAVQMIGESSALWGARCDAYGEDDDHRIAWDWLRGGEAEEGVDLVAGSVRLTAPDGTRYRVAS
jgi:hypothetical protein